MVGLDGDPSLGEPDVSFSYTASGQRQSMADPSGTTSYTYDAAGRLNKITRTVYLPPGKWQDWFTGQRFAGGQNIVWTNANQSNYNPCCIC